MAQSMTNEFGAVYNAGAYASYKVQKTLGGLAANGVLMLVGEADQGPSYAEEESIASNYFSVDDKAAVIAKYGSGQLVDAYLGAIQASNDPEIVGAPSAIYLVKTNTGTKASTNLQKISGGVYAELESKAAGALGNLIYVSVDEETAESLPAVSFSWIPPGHSSGTSANICGNGNGTARACGTLAQGITPASLVSTVNAAAAGVNVVTLTGGTDRAVLGSPAGDTLTFTVISGLSVMISTSAVGGWAVTPTVGDTLQIAVGSNIKGSNTKNPGAYIVTAATVSTITATKLKNHNNTTTPLVEAASGVDTGPAFYCYAPVTVIMKAAFAPTTVSDGFGKSLEIADDSTGESFGGCCYTLVNGVPTPAAWSSQTSAGKSIGSLAEYAVTLNAARLTDGASESMTVGGDLAIKIGYTNGSCSVATVTISGTTLTTACTGATTSNLTLDLTKFKTLNDLANYIDAQQYYSASVGSGFQGQQPVVVDGETTLDKGTFNMWAMKLGAEPARIKRDAYEMYSTVAAQSTLVEFASQPLAGIPTTSTATYLTGGARGATLAADVVGAVDSCEKISGNFPVTLFSRDASADIVDGLTDAASTYVIDTVNAYVKTHVLAMSKYKRRRNRQAFVSKKCSFADAKEAAGVLASHRVTMTFQDSMNINSEGTLTQFQPWMLAVQAAAMQAAGFYKSILFKKINTSGVLVADGSFSDTDDSDREDAVRHGLLVAQSLDEGGFRWASDQTTYGTDDNFVWNSTQAVSSADIVSLGVARQMENAFVGQSLADVSAASALAFLKGVMSDLKRKKLLASSDDAPLGFKNARISISGNTMDVSMDIKLATAINFINIAFSISQVTQVAQ